MREIARSLCGETCPVTLIYVCASTTGKSAGKTGGSTRSTSSTSSTNSNEILRRRVLEVAGRHAGLVELVELTAEEAPDLLGGPGGASLLLVMRRGELFTQAAGPLPTSELDRVVRTALRWADDHVSTAAVD